MVETLKREFKCYKQYKKELEMLNEKLDVLWYDLGGVKGVRFDKQRGSTDKNAIEEQRFKMLENVEAIEEEIKRVTIQLRYLDNMLLEIEDDDDRQLIIDALINSKTLRELERFYYTSFSQLSKRINKILAKVIK